MFIAAGCLCLAIWVYLLVFHGRFWQISRFKSDISMAVVGDAIAVVVPARNEADVVAQSISSLLKQRHVDRLHVYLVDDGSMDGTAEVAKRAARETVSAAVLTVISGRSLPPGWSGKLWAVQQGVEAALQFDPKFILLTDADIVHGSESISTLASIAQSGSYDLVSFMVKLYCRTLAERALIPAFVYFFFQLYPPAWISDPGKRTAGAAGGSILIRPDALERAGGIAGIRGEVIDDCALARSVKQSGGRVWLGVTDETRSLRPYESFGEIGRMISRSAFNQLRHSGFLLSLATVGMLVTYLLPPILAIFSRHILSATLGTLAWMLMATSFYPIIRFYKLNALWSFTLPLIALFYLGATLHSAFKFWTGKGGEWKGRVQDRKAEN